MRHGKKFNHLGRTASHRKAMLSNMASSLIFNKRISTTVAKAKALRKYIEPIMTKAKDDTTHSRRVVFSYLQNKESVQLLFDEIAEKIADRPGGYTRIIKTGNRLGDNADMCIIELVDYNELLLKEAKPKAKSTRRSRRGSGKGKSSESEKQTAKAKVVESEEKATGEVEEKIIEATDAEPKVEAETKEAQSETKEEKKEEAKAEKKEEKVEAKAEEKEKEQKKDQKEDKKEEDKKEDK